MTHRAALISLSLASKQHYDMTMHCDTCTDTWGVEKMQDLTFHGLHDIDGPDNNGPDYSTTAADDRPRSACTGT